MATVSSQIESSAAGSEAANGRPRRRKTSHLKAVPEPRELRDRIQRHCREAVALLDKSQPMAKEAMERVARDVLDRLEQPESLVGWTMVTLASEFWRDQVAAVPYDRRLLLLPHCLKHAEGCPADYDEFGLDCKKCGACSIADYRAKAESLGYKVLVAEGSPIVLKIIVGGYIDAIVGVACLNVLEKAIDKILLAGVPCIAVPLLSSDCRNTSVDEDLVAEMIGLEHRVPEVRTRSYVPLMRAAETMFQPDDLARLVPRRRGSDRDLAVPSDVARMDPIGCTEAIAVDFLARGGKHSRPFITLAAYDAMTGGKTTESCGEAPERPFPDAVLRAAMSIETFHKASLVHDDIEDDDRFRYGDETLHTQYGTPTAINVGDYLIGLGYRLVSRETKSLGSDTVADLLETLADAHMRLSEGQGAELLWRDARPQGLLPIDALKIYALKTAPAFEAALMVGLRLAGDVEPYRQPVAQFARHLGIAFQILNDLKDWCGDTDNKLTAGNDLIGSRPTLLLALGLEALPESNRAELERAVREGPESDEATEAMVHRAREWYCSAGIFDTAHRLVDKYEQRAEQIAEAIEPEPLRRLFFYLIDTVLDRRGTDLAEPALVTITPAQPMQES